MNKIAIVVGMLCLTAGKANSENLILGFEEQVAQGVRKFSKPGLMRSAAILGSTSMNLGAQNASKYCLATYRHAEEGFPKYWYEINCKDRKPFASESKICWRFSDAGHRECIAEISRKLRTLMGSKGYDELGRFKFGGEMFVDYVFQKSASNQSKDACLVRRTLTGPLWPHAAKVEYTIDCNDGALTILGNIEPNRNSTEAINRYMQKRGYGFVEIYDYNGGYIQKLIFQR